MARTVTDDAPAGRRGVECCVSGGLNAGAATRVLQCRHGHCHRRPIFLSHGSPMTALEPREAGAFMQRLGPAIDAAFGRPRAVARGVGPHAWPARRCCWPRARHEAVYDFGGFDPRPLHAALRRARRAGAGRRGRGAAAARPASTRTASTQGGLDHGIWTPLRYLCPQADVPVLPLAFVPTWSPAQLFALGAALAPLAARGRAGDGQRQHHAQPAARLCRRPGATSDTAGHAREHGLPRLVRGSAAQPRDWDALFDYRRQAPHAVLMHPTDEHLLPWYVAAGAGGREAAGAAPARERDASATWAWTPTPSVRRPKRCARHSRPDNAGLQGGPT